ncbi:MAG: XRE family transcriptional regulator [Burkholderiales bacterium]|nr:MAG: XRE family transcriptional regulator [Burkholderiales bacterium]
MNSKEWLARVVRAHQVCLDRGITQAEVASATGASQPQVSRLLQGKFTRPSKLLEEICLYVERQEKGVTGDAVRANDELISALSTTWDGSASHAKALALVIRSLSTLGTASGGRGGQKQ